MKYERENKENLFQSRHLGWDDGQGEEETVTLVDEDVGNESFLEERLIPTAPDYLLRPGGGEPG